MKPDSLIFDMDGTLWDATDSYVLAWNEGLKLLKRPERVDRAILDSMMGWERNKVFQKVFPTVEESAYDAIYQTINSVQDKIIPEKGGVFYPDVIESLKLLSKKYKLFILSNCPANTIKQMIAFGHLEKYITDEIAHGFNHKAKHFNINLLIEKHKLKSTLYIGDTNSDSLQCQIAKIPFCLVTYGFGSSETYDYKFESFKNLANYFLDLT